MSTQLIENPRGSYRFLRGIEPYSSGVVASPGWEIVHATLAQPLAWHDGLCAIRKHLEQIGRDRYSLCGVELRCPEPFSMDGFIAFNRQYRSLLEDWEMLVDDENPIARTNVSPVNDPPHESVVYGFSYTEPSDLERSTFIVAGGGELEGALDARNIVCSGDTSAEAMREKAQCVVNLMKERLSYLGNHESLSQINVYTAHDLRELLSREVIPGLPSAARLGVHWHYSYPPVHDIEFEMDLRGVVKELIIDLS